MEEVHQSAANDNVEDATAAIALRKALELGMRELAVASFEERERSLLKMVNAALRETLRSALQQRSDELPSEVTVDGVLHRRHQPGEVTVHSLCGPLLIKRWTYRRVGERNGPLCVPLELEAGIVERVTPALAYGIVRAYAKSHMRDYEEDLDAAHRVPPSRSTLERVAKALGTQAKLQVYKIEPQVRAAEDVPEESHSISVGLDRTTIPMEEDAENPKERPKRATPYVRARPGAVEVKYRMAYVGTVALCDRAGDPICVRRYAVAAHERPEHMIRRMMRDVRHALERRPDLHVSMVQDGAPDLWHMVRDALQAEPFVKELHCIIDYYHVAERLGLVANMIERDERRRLAMLACWKRSLLKNDRAIYGILRAIRRVSHEWPSPLSKKAYLELLGHEGYLTSRALHMKYAGRRELGLPIGSGITEGACKSMIMARTKRSGQRWRPAGVDAVLAVRGLLQSDRLKPFWNRFKTLFSSRVAAA